MAIRWYPTEFAPIEDELDDELLKWASEDTAFVEACAAEVLQRAVDNQTPPEPPEWIETEREQLMARDTTEAGWFIKALIDVHLDHGKHITYNGIITKIFDSHLPDRKPHLDKPEGEKLNTINGEKINWRWVDRQCNRYLSPDWAKTGRGQYGGVRTITGASFRGRREMAAYFAAIDSSPAEAEALVKAAKAVFGESDDGSDDSHDTYFDADGNWKGRQ